FFSIGKTNFKVVHIPGHTLGHICFFSKQSKALFVGDTLFSLGCGRIFEGTFEQMFESLEKIKNLPKDTMIYCGHEYTDNNGKFCISIDKKNEKLKDRIKEVQIKRKRNQPTLPISLGQELDTNIFLRCDDKKIKNNIKMKTSSELEIFTKLRNLKDKF
ncbi:MAG: hydroxyacylglutathione hydrolase, partial [Pelagibacteraceae bacterium]|nr:hydroxyacylglutathione hydrolase [Pelagibacteraceae bacterium]